MATEESISMEAMDIQGGKITFAPDVIATIASLAANEVEGIDSLGGTVVEGITGMLSKKSMTKGVKVDINDNTATIDISAIIKYGFKIHEVSANLQRKVKSTIENMTGLNVTAGVGLLLGLIAIVLIIGFNRRAPKNQAPASAVISQNEMGISSITLAAIDDMVKRHCATANGNVKKCDSRIAVVENKLKIDLRVVIAEEANIPETTEALRTSLIDYIQTITGIQVSDVSILVSTEPEKKAEA